ncbi:RsiW-degrading membrane proteinase PrsW (M82 family) [Microbacterium halimionae]|uniref:RsiW-degrading membrane proteinase PrsW (M82 family) n=1 Tax=Microbacterium halimionae TaxID=1526413 RepID=A0A7W3PM30_9MICO|nr:PrsW family intramembrane metalloprotease [Microbacterium halimionae]MBA8816479.1 RsiW-degrading membrane proteinase PrsW (M82 family) [Microbacterium halimionae]NII95334.1 RsiW-degrading membrane proteinase PrsW (M82 family) [Microbacterium halimionae]
MTFPSDDERPQRPRPSLTPPSFSELSTEPPQGAVVGIPAVDVTFPTIPPEHSSRANWRPAIWLVGALVIVLVILIAYFLSALGSAASLVGMLLALIPLAVVFLAVRAIDRWEPEPPAVMALAVAWGGVGAVGITLGVDLAITLLFGSEESAIAVALTTVVQAPFVEEVAKGLGVLLIFLIFRSRFDGPVDGLVYGALVGAGFAFTENIQYFAIAFISGGVDQTGVTFFMRGILSPFAHVMFTSITGLALGIAACRGLRPAASLRWWILGVAGAIVLHALWNASAVFFDFFALYALVQVPLFIVFILGIVALRRAESRLTRARLSDYAAVGWFTIEEVDMLSTGAGRRKALAWAATLHGDKTSLMKSFIADATSLAAARQRVLSGRDDQAQNDERALLTRATATRSALFSL